ncbi:hypothetical protein OTB20_08455 [Streptomyces sp. H27-H1]|uniref:hypothetical protein n=1 Tax=Streptomyces sp. H27-H1 TaxID=2996461 RepID=UPI0022710C1B|nr:hypothetical protein [Streptomyces sp. H27-H1]MCY0926236.1 hypothetical protein [Streptomyces sp. H27-H1]
MTIRRPLVALALVAPLLLTACAAEDNPPSDCYEIDIDHPKPKKTTKPVAPKPAAKPPTTTRKR